MKSSDRDSALAYGVSLTCLAASIFLRWLLNPVLGDTLPLTTLFAAIGVAVWIGGYGPAVVVAALGYASCYYLFISPHGQIDLSDTRNVVGFIVFLVTAFIIIYFGEALRRAQKHHRLGEESARQQSELVRITLASIGDGVIATDADGRITTMNAVAEALTGWTSDEAAGVQLTDVFRIVNESTRLKVDSPALRALKEGVIVGLANHTLLIAKDGSERPIDDSAAPIRGHDGEIVGCVLVFRDISERHRIEVEQQMAQKQIATTLESVTDGLMRFDGDWRIVYVNAEAEVINRLTRSEMLGRILWEVFPAIVGTKLEAEYRRAVTEQVTVEFENYYEPFGRWYSLKGYPTPDGGLTMYIRDITQQKAYQEALQRSEARLRRVFESNVVGMIRWDLDRSLILDANETFLRMSGYTRDDVTAGRLNFRDMTPAEWTARNEEGVRAIQSDGFAAPYEKEYFRKDGSRLPLIIAGTRFEDSPSEGMSILIDISESKRAEREVVRIAAESERQRRLYETVLTNTPDFVYVFSLDHKVVYANDALIKMWGRELHEVIGKTFLEIGYEPWHAEMHNREIDQVRDTHKPIRGEVPFNGTNGRRDYDYIFVPVFGADGEVEAVAGTTRDVTDQKRAESNLRESEQRFREMANAAPAMIWVTNEKHECTFLSQSWFDFTGQRDGEGLRFGWVNAVHPEDREAAQLTFISAAAKGESFELDYRLQTADGNYRWAIDAGKPRFKENGEFCGFVGSVVDDHDRHEFQSALNEAVKAAEAANESKSAFLANMSHEIRTPMTAILGYADLLKDLVHQDDATQHLQTIRNNGSYLLDIINDILDLSKIEAGKLDVQRECFEPHRLIEDVRSIMEIRAKECGLTLEVQYGSKLPKVILSDAKRLKQILINLVGNAIKFTHKGQVQICVGFDITTRRLHFDVIDTGIGISPEQMDHLFKPFSQGDASVSRNFGGTGLGLIISQRLAEMLGGSIAVRSTQGAGSTFSVSIATGENGDLNLVDYASMTISNETASEVSMAEQIKLACHILIVDDRRDIRYLSRYILTRSGATVKECEDGLVAVEHVTACLKDGSCPDLILLDMQMPNLDGYATAQRLRSLGYAGPIIALTADAMQSDMNKCLEVGCNDYLSKPINKAQLLTKVADLTNGDNQ